MTRAMKSLLISVSFIVTSAFLFAFAHADPASGSSAAAVTAPAPAGVVTSQGIIDPTSDPAGYGSEVFSAYKGGEWLLMGVLVAFGIDALLLAGAKRWPDSKLGKYVTPITVVGTALTGIATVLVPGVSPDYKKLLAMVLGAVLVYLAPASKTQASAPAAS